MIFGERIVAEAKNWLGVKYQHRGISKRGCDCTGLIIGVLQSLSYMPGYKLREYPKDWNLHAGAGDYIREEISKVADKVNDSSKQAGDILLFRFGKCIAHCGIFIGKAVFVHCYLGSGKVCKSVLAPQGQWNSRLAETYRINESRLGVPNG